MRNRNLKYIIGVFILLLSFDLTAQINEMEMNDNRIDQDFVPSSELKAKINDQNKTENEINLILEKTEENQYSIYVLNKTIDSLSISKQDWSLYLIQEAKNKNGEWKPIEYWQYATCGNSYLSNKLEPNGILKTKSIAYNGNFETKIRFKLLNNNHVYYSNPVIGLVNLSQFLIPKNITRNRIYAIIDELGGSELMNKMLFLEPNGMKEFEKKQEAYLIKMSELRKRNKN